MSTLSKEDKIQIITQHKRNLDYARYNIEISILEEESSSNPSQASLSSLNSQIADIDKKLKALDDEQASL